MNIATKNELLSNPQAVDEIKRHLWIESEKAGYDIGFEAAAEDWFAKYANDWISQYMPKKKSAPVVKKGVLPKKTATVRKRSAKTYM
jgi:hypothetical protein